MRNFLELFTDARAVSTPIIAVRTFDPASTIKNVRKVLGKDADKTPLLAWDSLHGLKSINDGGKDNAGSIALATMASASGMPVEELQSTVDLPIALGLLEFA